MKFLQPFRYPGKHSYQGFDFEIAPTKDGKWTIHWTYSDIIWRSVDGETVYEEKISHDTSPETYPSAYAAFKAALLEIH